MSNSRTARLRLVKRSLWSTFLCFGLLLIIAGVVIAIQRTNQPRPFPIDSSKAAEVKTVIKRMYLLERNITCDQDTDVNVLSEVLVDSLDYRSSSADKTVITKVYGNQALKKAGLLTAKQAYYLSRRFPTPVTLPAGILPTATPIYYCPPDPESRIDQSLDFVSIALGNDGRAVVRYNYGGGLQEAVLRPIDGRWMITSIKLIRWYGI